MVISNGGINTSIVGSLNTKAASKTSVTSSSPDTSDSATSFNTAGSLASTFPGTNALSAATASMSPSSTASDMNTQAKMGIMQQAGQSLSAVIQQAGQALSGAFGSIINTLMNRG